MVNSKRRDFPLIKYLVCVFHKGLETRENTNEGLNLWTETAAHTPMTNSGERRRGCSKEGLKHNVNSGEVAQKALMG